MALTQSNSTMEPRSFSNGPVKMQIIDIQAESADTSGTVTADNLSKVEQVVVTGVTQTAAATMSGNTATLTFADPGATVVGTVICYGR